MTTFYKVRTIDFFSPTNRGGGGTIEKKRKKERKEWMANTLTLVHDMRAEMEGELNDDYERFPKFVPRLGYVCLGKKGGKKKEGRKKGRKKRTQSSVEKRDEMRWKCCMYDDDAYLGQKIRPILQPTNKERKKHPSYTLAIYARVPSSPSSPYPAQSSAAQIQKTTL